MIRLTCKHLNSQSFAAFTISLDVPDAVCGFADTKERVVVFGPFNILFSCLVRAHPPPLDRIPKESGRKAHCSIETKYIMQSALDHSGSQRQLLLKVFVVGWFCSKPRFNSFILLQHFQYTSYCIISDEQSLRPRSSYLLYIFKSKSLLLLLQGDVVH